MKNLFRLRFISIVLLVFIGIAGFSQPIGSKNSTIIIQGKGRIDTLLILPLSDTTTAPKIQGGVIYQISDKTIYYYDGVQWKTLASSTGAAGIGAVYAGNCLIKINDSTLAFDPDCAGITDTSGVWISDLYRRSDSVFYVKGGDEIFAYIDSAGGSILDTTFQWSVLDSLSTPNGGAVSGDIYLVGTAPTGVFVGHANEIATYDGANYSFQTANVGDLLYNAATDFVSKWTGTAWVRVGRATIHQGGDKYATTIKIGANDNRALSLKTNNINRISIAAAGGITLNSLTGAGNQIVGIDANGLLSRVSAASDTITASEGLTKIVNDIQIGGTFTASHTITQGTNQFTLTGSNTSGQTLQVNNTSSGNAISATASGAGTGIVVSSASGTAITASGTTGMNLTSTSFGVLINSTSSSTLVPPLYVANNNSGTANIQDMIQLLRNTTGTAANGFGQSINLFTEDASGASSNSGKIINKWTTAANATRTSSWELQNVNSAGALTTRLNLAGNGLFTLGGYASRAFYQNDTTTYKPVLMDNSGNMYQGSWTNGSTALGSALTNTHLFVGNASNVATDVAASGDLTLANTGAFILNTVNSNVGTFGDATHIPIVTVNGKGLITAISNSASLGYIVDQYTSQQTARAWFDSVKIQQAKVLWNGLGSTTTSAFIVANESAAATGQVQNAPRVEIVGQEWLSTNVSTPYKVFFTSTPTNNATTSRGTFKISSSAGDWFTMVDGSQNDMYQITSLNQKVTGNLSVENIIPITSYTYVAGNNRFQNNIQLVHNNTYEAGDLSKLQIGGDTRIYGSLFIDSVTRPVFTISTVGTPGSTSYTYVVVGELLNGQTTEASLPVTITTGNLVLDVNNYNFISVTSNNFGVYRYRLYRTASGGTPSTLGFIGSYAGHIIANGNQTTFDKGAPGDGTTAPTQNTTGNIGIGLRTATARLHIGGGLASPGSAPIKLSPGVLLTVPEDGAVNYDGTHLYFTIGATRYQLDQQGGGGGETNTASNLGGGLANYSTKVGVDLRFNSFAAADFDLTSNLITYDYINGQKATGSVNGILSSTDWTTFNNKLGSISGISAGGDLTGTYPNPTVVWANGYTDYDARYSLLAHTHTFASLTSKPTTIAGYGITDFNSLGDARWSLTSHNHTLDGLSNVTITSKATNDLLKWDGSAWVNFVPSFLTSYTETDPLALKIANNLSDGTPATMRTNLGLVIGTNVQAYDADLTTYAGITPSANVQTLLGAANYAAFRTSLSLGNVENTALSTWAGSTNITTLGTVTSGTWNGTALTSTYLPSSVVYNNQANTYTAGMKQTFQADATNAGLKFGGVTANPSALAAGDAWYRSDENKFHYYDGTTDRKVVAEALTQVITNKDLTSTTNTFPALTGDVTKPSGSNVTTIADAFKFDYIGNIEAGLGSAIKAESVPLNRMSATNNLQSQNQRMIAVWLPKAQTITGVKWFQTVQGVYTANNYNGVGLYTYDGAGNLTLVASSTDDGSIWSTPASNSWSSKAFSSTYSAAAGLYFVTLLYCSSAQTTAPAIGATQGLQNAAIVIGDFTNSGKIVGNKTSTTSLATTTMSAFATSSNYFYIALY